MTQSTVVSTSLSPEPETQVTVGTGVVQGDVWEGTGWEHGWVTRWDEVPVSGDWKVGDVPDGVTSPAHGGPSVTTRGGWDGSGTSTSFSPFEPGTLQT